MGLLSLATGSQRNVQFITKDKGTVIALDASISESHTSESTPTEFPVEDGSTVSDHMIVKPRALQINGIISDTPIKDLTSLITSAVGAFIPPTGILPSTAGLALFSALKSSSSLSVDNYKKLIGLQQNKTPFDVITTLTKYDNMRIKTLTVPRDNGTGRALIFTVDLVQLILVSPKTVNIQIFQNSDLSAQQAKEGKQEANSEVADAVKKGHFNALGILGQ